MAPPVQQALTGQSVSEFKQAVRTTFKHTEPQFCIMHNNRATQPSTLPLWKRFGPVCSAVDEKPVVFIQCEDNDDTRASTRQRKTSVLACHVCETVYSYNLQSCTSALSSHKCQAPLSRLVDPIALSTLPRLAFSRMLDRSNWSQKHLGKCVHWIFAHSWLFQERDSALLCRMCLILEYSPGIRWALKIYCQTTLPSKDPWIQDACLQVILMSKVQHHVRCGLWAAFTLDIWTDDNH